MTTAPVLRTTRKHSTARKPSLRRRILAASIATALAMPLCFQAQMAYGAAPELVTNGGFETGNFSGWTQSGNTGATFVGASTVHGGAFSAALGPVGSTGSITQLVSTVVGRLYRVSYFLQNNGGTPNSFAASFGGATLTSGSNLASQPYTQAVFTGRVATSASTSLVFTFQQNPSFFHLDDVSVTQVPAATHWLGGTDGKWTGNVNNWASDAAGTATIATPMGLDDITFSATGAGNQSTTLERDFTVHSLTISTTQAVTIESGAGGPHTLTLAGTAGTGINVQTGAGLLTIGANLTLAGASDTITVNNAPGAVIDGNIAGANGLIKAGTGALTLAGTNTYTGGTTVSAGTIFFDNNAALSAGTVTLGDANTGANATSLLATAPMNSDDGAVGGGAIANNIVVSSQGTGTATIGTTSFPYAGGFGSTTFTGTLTLNRATTLQGGNADRTTYTGVISGNVGILTIDGGARTVLGGAADNTFVGDVNVTGAGTILQIGGSANVIPDTSNVNLGAGTTLFMTKDTGAESINALTGTGTVSTNIGAVQTLTVGAADGSGTFGGVIEDGAGILALTKTGTGTQTLTGANTFSGGTTVAAGTLFLGDGTTPGAALGTGDVTVNGGATLTLDLANNETFANTIFNGGHVIVDDAVVSNYTVSGDISGSGDLTKAGGNTVTLSGNNTYTGPTAVNGGRLLAGSSAAFGTNSAVTIAPGAALDIGGFNNAIGSLAGSGDVFLAANNLSVGGNNASTTFSGTIQDGGAAGGTGGSLTKTGTGTLWLSGINTYTGPTTVNGGTLFAGSTQALGLNSAVTVNANSILDIGFNTTIGSLAGGGANSFVQDKELAPGPTTLTTGTLNTDTTYSGVIQNGAGVLSLVKVGAGTQTLTGTNTYTGGTTLFAGTLAAGNAKAFGNGNLTLRGGTLRTTGGPLSVDVGAGNILFGGGTYLATVGGTAPGVTHDQLKTTGSANISGGTLALVQLNGFRLVPGDKIVLLSALGGVAGGSANGTAVPGSNVTGLAAFGTVLIVPVVNLYTDSVVLEAIQGSFGALAATLAFTPNQIAVAAALDSVVSRIGAKTGVIKEIDYLDLLPASAIAANLEMLSPSDLTSIFHIAVSLAKVQAANIQQRLEDIRSTDVVDASSPGGLRTGGGSHGPKGPRGKAIAPAPEERWGLFVLGNGEFTQVGSTTNAAGFSLDSGGVTAGVDYRFTNHFAAGISIGYMNTTANLSNRGKVDVDGGRVGAYATYFDRGLHFDAAVSGGPNSYRTRRTTPNNTTATASPQGTEVNLLFAAGYDWKFKGITLGPVASFQYTNVQLDGFTETGTFAPLSVIRKNSDSMRSALGFHATFDANVGRAVIRPEVRAAWQHEFGDTSYSLTSTFATLGGSPFTVAGPATGRDSLLVGAGFSILWNARFSTAFFYDGELLRTNYSSNNVSVGFRLQF